MILLIHGEIFLLDNIFHFCSVKILKSFSHSGVARGGGQGAMAPPKPEIQGAKLSFGPPPHSRYTRFFFSLYMIHYFLLYTWLPYRLLSSQKKSFFFRSKTCTMFWNKSITDFHIFNFWDMSILYSKFWVNWGL